MLLRERINCYKRIRMYSGQVKKYNMFLFGVIFIEGSLSLFNTYLFQVLVDKVIVNKEVSFFSWSYIYISVFVTTIILNVLICTITNKMENKITYNVQKEVWNSLICKSEAEIRKYDMGDIKTFFELDCARFGGYVKEQIIDFSLYILQSILCLSIMIYYSWTLSIICILLIPFTFFLGKKLAILLGDVWREFRTINNKFESFIIEAMRRWFDIKILSLEDKKIAEFSNYAEQMKIINLKKMFIYSISRIAALLKNEFFVKIVLYFLGGFLIINDDLSIGELLVYMKVYNMLLSHIENANNNNINLGKDIIQIERVLEFIANRKDFNENFAYDIQGNICFNDVSFSYDCNSPKILSNLNFYIKAGTICIINGRSGIGKSTIVKLLTGKYMCDQGEIRIDSYNIKDVVNTNFFEEIGVVTQEEKFFNMSIRNNMQLVKNDIEDKELDEIFEKVGLSEFINDLVAGYDTVIGEQGIKLSGGQRQRLSIARVLLKNPKIMIFDEATSKLDGCSEELIYSTLKQLKGKKTIILITHRLSTVDFADCIINI